VPGFVKTEADEKLWQEAKQKCRAQGLSGDDFWACANAEFHRRKGRKSNPGHDNPGSDNPVATKEKWISGAIKRPGRLHRYFDVKPNEKIPRRRLLATLRSKKASNSIKAAIRLALKLKKWAGRKRS